MKHSIINMLAIFNNQFAVDCTAALSLFMELLQNIIS